MVHRETVRCLWSTGTQSGVYGPQGHNQLFLWSSGTQSAVYGPQGHSQLFYGPLWERSLEAPSLHTDFRQSVFIDCRKFLVYQNYFDVSLRRLLWVC